MTAQTDRDTAERYRTAIAAFDVAHGLNRHGLTPEQHRRWLAWIHCLDAGVDPQRCLYARHLIATGAIRDDADPRDDDEARLIHAGNRAAGCVVLGCVLGLGAIAALLGGMALPYVVEALR